MEDDRKGSMRSGTLLLTLAKKKKLSKCPLILIILSLIRKHSSYKFNGTVTLHALTCINYINLIEMKYY